MQSHPLQTAHCLCWTDSFVTIEHAQLLNAYHPWHEAGGRQMWTAGEASSALAPLASRSCLILVVEYEAGVNLPWYVGTRLHISLKSNLFSWGNIRGFGNYHTCKIRRKMLVWNLANKTVKDHDCGGPRKPFATIMQWYHYTISWR